jgi:protein O-mannosyl-transferase
LGAGLCALVLAAYASSFGLGFAGDPMELVLKDPRIRAATAENLGLILRNDYWYLNYSSGLYRPVTTASFLLNYAILGNGESAAGYHLLNFLLHAANVWLVFLLARRLFERTEPALLAAALWAVHPIGTECVTNIGGRADLLAAMAVLGGLLLYLRGLPVALFAVAVVGVFSKENAAVLLGLMALWDLAFGARPRRLASYAAVAGSLVAMWAVRQLVFRSLPWAQAPFVDNPLVGADFWTARLTAIKVIAMDLGLLIWPANLASDRSYNQIPVVGWADGTAWIGLAVLLGILTFVLWNRRKDRLLFWAAGFFGIALLPVSNLLMPVGSIMAERFLYLPAVGFAVAIAALAGRIPRQRVRIAVVGALVVLFALRTNARNSAWEDNLALASTDVQTAPQSFKLHTMLALELARQDARANIDRVIQEQETAYEILRPLPDSRMPQQSLIHLGDAYLVKGNLVGGPATPEGRGWFAKAVPVLERAREISQLDEKAWDETQRLHGRPLGDRYASQDLYYDLGVAYGSLDRYAEALETLRYGRNIGPARVDFYAALSAAYTGLQNPEASAQALLEGAMVRGEAAPVGSGNLCAAAKDLEQAYTESRHPAEAREVKQRYGCK